MQDLLQILQLLTALNPSEVFFGPKQRGRRPAQNHAWAVPAFDSAGPVGVLGKTVLDQVSVGQSPAERMTNAQSLNRQRFFQAFQQAVGRDGREAIQPPSGFRQFFLGACNSAMTLPTLQPPAC